jgi:AraC-like DNA-binding protein
MMLYIKNMESSRCKAFVTEELYKLGLYKNRVELGEVELKEEVTKQKLQLFDIALKNAGLEILFNKETLLIQKIKDAIYQWICLSADFTKPNFSDYISEKVNRDYSFLSNLFTQSEGESIEKYIIVQKIKRVKELLVYEKLSLSDIAYELQYSSVSHLSNQFKKVIGLTPSFFRQHRNSIRYKSLNV